MKYFYVQSTDDLTSVWIVIADDKDLAIEKFCKKTSFPRGDFEDETLLILEETPIV